MIDTEFHLLRQYPCVFWTALGIIWILCLLELHFWYTVETAEVIDLQNVQIPPQELMNHLTLARAQGYYRACGRHRFGTYLSSAILVTSVLVFNGLYTEWSWSIKFYQWIQDTFGIPKAVDPNVGVAVIFLMIDTFLILVPDLPHKLIRRFVIEANYNFNTLTWSSFLGALIPIMVTDSIFWPIMRIIIVGSAFAEGMPQEEPDDDGPDKLESEVTSPKLTTSEVMGILAHQVGHRKHGHGTKIQLYRTFVEAIRIVILFVSYKYIFVFPDLPAQEPPPGQKYRIFSWVILFIYGPELPIPISIPSPGVAISIGLLMINRLLDLSLDKISDMILNIMSRRFELAADSYAVGLGYGEDLKGALVKLHAYNLVALNSKPSLLSSLYSGHHTLLERIEAINVFSSSVHNPSTD